MAYKSVIEMDNGTIPFAESFSVPGIINLAPAKALYVLFLIRIEIPFERILQKPLPILMVANVATNAGTFKKEIKNPFTIPTKTPTRMHAIKATCQGSIFSVIRNAATIPVRPTVDPTEISICPIRMANSIPHEIIVLTALFCNMVMIFDGVRKFLVKKEKNVVNIINPIMTPEFLLKYVFIGFDICSPFAIFDLEFAIFPSNSNVSDL